MLFWKKNKIDKGIDKASEKTISEEIDSEFELLTKVKRRNDEKKLIHLLFVQPFISLKNNTIEKYQAILKYFKNNYVKLYFYLFISLFLITLAIGLWIAFSPYPAVVNGDYQVAISNFYLAKNGSPSGLTPIGIAFILLLIITIGLGLFYAIKFKRKDLIINRSRLTIVLSIINYVILGIGLIFLLVLIFIVPKTIVSANQQEVYNLIIKIKNSEGSIKLSYIQELAKLTQDPKYNMTPLTNVSLEGYDQWLLDSGYFSSIQSSINSLIYSNNIGSMVFNLLTTGKVIISFVAILFIISLVILPFTLFIIVSFDQLNNQDAKLNNWSSFRLRLISFINGIKNIFVNIKNKSQKKDSFHKYKKRVKDKGVLYKENNREFTTDISKSNTVKQSITREEIEMNPANVAFLSKEGKWMYHDGKGNYFIAKGNQWEKYDIDHEVHIAHANIVNESLNLDPTNKKAKDDKLSFLRSKKESSIALPDEEIDQIARDLKI